MPPCDQCFHPGLACPYQSSRRHCTLALPKQAGIQVQLNLSLAPCLFARCIRDVSVCLSFHRLDSMPLPIDSLILGINENVLSALQIDSGVSP